MADDAPSTPVPSAKVPHQGQDEPAPRVVPDDRTDAFGPPTGPELAVDPLSTRARVALLVGPIGALVVLFLVLHTVVGPSKADALGAAAVASAAALGTTVVFGAAVLTGSAARLSTFELVQVVWVVGTAMTAVYVGAYDLLERIPLIGPRLVKARTGAARAEHQRPRMRGFATVGLALYATLPLPTCGIIGSTVVGRIVGLSRWRTFFAVVAGHATKAALYALAADELRRFMERTEMTIPQRLAAFAAVVMLFLLVSRWIAHRRRRTSRAVSPPPPR